MIHRLDSRVKLVSVVVFSMLTVTVPIEQLGSLAWYAVFPFVLLVAGRIPLKFAAKQILIVSPIIWAFGISSVIFEREPQAFNFGPFSGVIALGWLRFFSIACKFSISMGALIALVSTTRFDGLLLAMEKIGVPRILVVQLGFLYRYIFLLIDKAGRMLRARSARRLAYLGLAMEIKVGAAMIGKLLLSSVDMAQQTGLAMEARGFTGRIHTLAALRFGKSDGVFAVVVAAYLCVIRTVF